ncbi:MAG: GxxExxY protein [Fluviicola sp.]|jgi:GxxExxY protein
MTKTEVKQLSYDIIDSAIKVHTALGAGLLESVYQKCLEYELRKSGFHVQTEVRVPINYDGLQLDTDLRLDLLVNDCVLVELKAVENLQPIHSAQLMTYMRLLKKPQGLLINFHTHNITHAMKPLVNEIYRSLPDY